MTVLHATEAASVYLSTAARVADVTVADIDEALYVRRSVVKQIAMRRTVFAFPRDLLPAALGSASPRVAAPEFAKLTRDVVAAGLAIDGAAWLRTAEAAILEFLRDRPDASAQEIREQVPAVQGTVVNAPGTKWSRETHVAPLLLTVLGCEGKIVRGHNRGHWRISKPAWTPTQSWLGGPVDALESATGYAELVRRWLATFGPGTERDIVWWLGSTKTAVRRALTDVEAVQVRTDRDGVGWVLPDDVEPEPDVAPWTALLPALDPTTMGWKERDFYLAADDVPFIFDSAGNGGSTAWWNGRIVGCWLQDPDGTVQVIERRPLPADARAALTIEAERLTDWLDGVVVSSPYMAQQRRSAKLP